MTTTNTDPAATDPAPFACPNCGSTDQWKADYNEAVWQTVTLADVDGEPQLIDYTGVTGTYDDGSSQDESYQCGCGHVIELGRFEFVPTASLRAAPEIRERLRDLLAELTTQPLWNEGARGEQVQALTDVVEGWHP